MNCKEIFYSAITFSLCPAQANKILAIILSSIRFGLYLTTFILLRVWNKETKVLESFCIFQFVYEIIILSTAILMFIFSKFLNGKWIYRFLRIHTVIITIYLFLNFFIDVCIFAGIKYKEFPDLYSLNEDPIFNYTDDELSNSVYSLKRFIIKDTEKINISLINDTIFSFTYLVKNNGQIYVPDPRYFHISFNNETKGGLKSYQKRHRFEFNIAMKFQLINIILGILSFFLWNNIRFKHKKLIQNKVIKQYGRKIIYSGYLEYVRVYKVFIALRHDEYKEENAQKEISNNENYINYSDIFSCSIFLIFLMELFVFFGSLITFFVLILQEKNFTTKALHFPFTLTFFGDGLYSYLVIFLIVIFSIDSLCVKNVAIFINHHKNMNNTCKQRLGCFILFTFGTVNLFFSICGILGTLFFIVGDIDSNGSLYIKTACIDSDISCYGLFHFASSFPLDNKKYSIIFYYIYLKKIPKSDQRKNIAKLFIIFIIFLIYFFEFYDILFDKMIDFNFDKIRFGKCQVHDYIIKDNSEPYLLDDIYAKIEDSEQYYKNSLNDSYFNIIKKDNNNKKNDKNERKDVQIVENENKSKTQTSGRVNQANIESTLIRIISNLKVNK